MSKFKSLTALIAVAGLSVAALSACTTTTKVAAVQPGDQAMSCTELKNEFDRLDGVIREAERNQGVNTANVAAVLLFWPAAVGNWLNADEAKDLVDERRAHQMTIYNNKRCDG